MNLEVNIVNKKIIGKDPRSSMRLPDFREKEPDIEDHYKSKQNELDSFWDGETISDETPLT